MNWRELVNHWWPVPFYLNGTGLTTSLMPYDGGGVEIEFDFVGHELTAGTTGGAVSAFPLRPMSVADFYRRFTRLLDDLGVRVHIYPRPVELPVAVPFADDTTHRAYDPAAMHAFWLSLVDAQRVLSRFRGEFTGRCSPVHFFWGAFDLAVTRFSGRGAPVHPGGVPNCPDRVMYAYPEPDGCRSFPIRPDAAHFGTTLGQFLLPYAQVRTAADPDAYLLEFLRSAYAASADLARWPDAF